MRHKALWFVFASLVFPIGMGSFCIPARADEGIRLRESFPSGYQYHVNCRSDVSGNMSLPADKTGHGARSIAVTGSSTFEYDERILSVDGNGVQKTMRIYRRINFQRKIGDEPQDGTLRPSVRRLVMLSDQNLKVPFSPDGPLTWPEIDLVRRDAFTPALAGLLPEKAVSVGDVWKATKAAVADLTDMEKIDEGEIDCRFDQITTLLNRRVARVAFSGAVRGINEDGPNKQQLNGHLFFDLDSNHVSYLTLQGSSSMLDKGGKVVGMVEGRFVVTRQPQGALADLSDHAVRGVNVEPDADNTLLLYDNPDLGVRFLHSRRWRVAGVHGKQVALDEANGSGLLITAEPASRVPTAAQFLVESRDWLQTQKAKIVGVRQPEKLRVPSQDLDHFVIDTEIAGQKVVMDYYVSRQAAAGATLAARLLPTDLDALQKDVERVARSIRLTEPAKGKSEPSK